MPLFVSISCILRPLNLQPDSFSLHILPVSRSHRGPSDGDTQHTQERHEISSEARALRSAPTAPTKAVQTLTTRQAQKGQR